MCRFIFLVLAAAMFSPGVSWSDTPPIAARPLTPDDVKAITSALASAPSQGLPVVSMAPTSAPGAGADPDQQLADAAIAYARAEHELIADPTKVDPNLALKPADDTAAQFAAARGAGSVPAWITAQAHSDPRYLALVGARDTYLAILAAGGWPTLPGGETVKPGARAARVAQLRRRLAIEGYVSAPLPPLAPSQPHQLDRSLTAALAAFQDHHGLKADGVLTSQTITALNVPVAIRLASIEANLERARWLPSQMPSERVEVDIGGPEATLFQGGLPVLTMRAVVGRPDRMTPTLASNLTAVKFNPPWIVPADIAAQELFPKERKSPGYFGRNGFEVVGGQVIQRPGPKASLGYVKFEMPDSFGVYLHDTPARSLFSHTDRWLSHGCMRLEKPRELAAALLAPQGWDRASVDASIAAGATKTIVLTEKTPVFVVYRTVVVDSDGHATFRSDVYGWDAEIEAALGAPRPLI